MADDKTDAGNQREKSGSSKPEGPGSTQRELLSEIKETLVAQSVNLGDSLGRDTINVRRHLLEMKNMTAEQLENQKALNQTFGVQLENEEDKLEGESVDNLIAQEERDDMQTIFEDIRDSIKNQTTTQSKQSAKAAGGMMSGMSKALGKVGIGIGAAGLGMGAMIGAGAYLLKVLDDVDGEKIKATVADLLSINDLVQKDGDAFIGEGGKFFLTMSGIGAGLLIFSVGAGLAAGVSLFTSGMDWTNTIKDNVATLLSIRELPGMGWDALEVSATLGGLGVGLAVFALGKAAAGIAEVGTDALEYFTKGGDWAQDIKNEVETLLSISELPGVSWKGMGKFIGVMGGLMAGLVAFSIGKGVAGAADVLTATTMFQGGNFAQDIKNEVATLLSISQIEGRGWDTAAFVAVMAGLAAGLVAFAVGKGTAGIADFMTLSSPGSNFAEDIKTEVATLLTIGDLPGASLENTNKSMAVLAALGGGLTAFGAGTFVGALGQAGAAILGFFHGGESPLQQALTLADNSERIDKGVESLQGFKDVLDDFSSMGNIAFEMNTEQMAEDLLGATEIFETALEGGTTGSGFFDGPEITFKGLLNIEGIKETAEEISLLLNSLIVIPDSGAVLNAAGNPALAGAGLTSVDQSTFAPTSLSTRTSVTNLSSLHPPADVTTKESLVIG